MSSPGLERTFRADRDAADFSGFSVLVCVEDEAWHQEGLGDLEAFMTRAAVATAARVGLPADIETELGAIFTDDDEVASLNAQWRGKAGPTNVLSFPLAPLTPGATPGLMLGDVVFARETLLRECASEAKSLSDHLCHLAVHGVLHCLGHDHVEAQAADAMERLETQILADLGIGDPYAAMPSGWAAMPAERTVR